MFGRKKIIEDPDYSKHIKVGEFYILATEEYEMPQEGVYKCTAKDEENVYFFSFIASGRGGFYINFRIIENDDWPIHMRRLLQMRPIDLSNSSPLFANVIRNIFQWNGQLKYT